MIGPGLWVEVKSENYRSQIANLRFADNCRSQIANLRLQISDISDLKLQISNSILIATGSPICDSLQFGI